MDSYQLSKKAADDFAGIAGIADYTIDKFGIVQAIKYRDGLHQTFERIVNRPS